MQQEIVTLFGVRRDFLHQSDEVEQELGVVAGKLQIFAVFPGGNEHMSFWFKSVWQERLKICNRNGQDYPGEAATGDHREVLRNKITAAALQISAGTHRGRYHSKTEESWGNSSVSHYGASNGLALVEITENLESNLVCKLEFGTTAIFRFEVGELTRPSGYAVRQSEFSDVECGVWLSVRTGINMANYCAGSGWGGGPDGDDRPTDWHRRETSKTQWEKVSSIERGKRGQLKLTELFYLSRIYLVYYNDINHLWHAYICGLPQKSKQETRAQLVFPPQCFALSGQEICWYSGASTMTVCGVIDNTEESSWWKHEGIKKDDK